jgi:capsular polysaccharide biosynthesis protein
MVNSPNGEATLEIATDLSLLETNAVAQQVVSQLRLPIASQTLLGQYEGVAEGGTVIQIEISAPSPAEALRRANALDAAFLTFRSHIYEGQNRSIADSLDSQVGVLQANERALTTEIATLPSGSGNGDQVTNGLRATLLAERAHDVTEIFQLQQTIEADNLDTVAILAGSQVLGSPVLVQSSHLKRVMEQGAAGLAAGLGVGLSIVAVPPLVSDRVRRRDDVAAALDAPVQLSVPAIRYPRLLAATRVRHRLRRPSRSIALITGYLASGIPLSSSVQSVLTVVSVASDDSVALSLLGLARVLTTEGKTVALIDASQQGLLARLFHVTHPPIKEIAFPGSDRPSVMILRTEEESSASAVRARLHSVSSSEEAARRPPDVVLVFASLDPASGARDLATWAHETTVLVTAGRSDAPALRVQAEMLQAATVRISAAILVGVDRTDDSFSHPVRHRAVKNHPRRMDSAPLLSEDS